VSVYQALASDKAARALHPVLFASPELLLVMSLGKPRQSSPGNGGKDGEVGNLESLTYRRH